MKSTGTMVAHQKGYRPDIDGLRAVAVLSVLVFHAFPNFLPGGFVGVDVFFVISGYLISGIICRLLDEERFDFLEFYSRRVRRIFPALILVLITTYAIGWATLLPGEFAQLGKHIAAGAGFASNFVLWDETGYFDISADFKPLLHLWSLGIEEQFYVVWPLAVWLLWKRRIGALPLIITVGLASFAINVATAHSHQTADFYSPLSRFWELQVGCILADLTRKNRSLPKSLANGASIAGAVAVVGSIALFSSNLSFPGWWALVPTIGTFLIIAAGPKAWVNRNVLSRSTCVWIGLISYPLYLWHWPLLSFTFINGPTPSIEMRLVILCASIMLASATYYVIDKPIRVGRVGKSKVFALLALFLLAGCVGYGTFAQGGVPSRFPKAIQQIADFKYDAAEGARAGACWLSATQPYNGFAQFCIAKSLGEKSIFVWGDSHAGRLYSGLRAVVPDSVGISQLTRDSCPPLLGFGYGVCQESNEYALSEIARTKPRTVILFAVWGHYREDWTGVSDAKTSLLRTIDKLKRIGIENIVVLGPAPGWNDALPRLTYAAWKNSHPFHTVPERMLVGLDPGPAKVDMQLSRLLDGAPVKYVSLMDLLCNVNGCLTHVPNHDESLLTWDYGHLTKDGAVLVSQHLVTTGWLELP